jgi:hypothetical protein
VNGLTELRTNCENTAGLLCVGSLPILIINTLGTDNELLDRLGGMCLLRDHRPRGEEETVEGHRLNAEHTSGPLAREVRPSIFNTTETRASEQDEVLVLPDVGISRENGLVEVLTRVVTTSTTTSPLENNGVVRVSGGDGYDLADAFDGAGFEGDMANAGRFQPLDDLCGLFCCGDTSGNTETFDGDALTLHILPEWELERKLAGVDVEGVESETDTGGDLREDFGNFRTQSCGVVVPTTSELGVVASAKGGTDKASLDSSRSHTGNHERWLAEETRERGINLQTIIAGGHINENNCNTSQGLTQS